MEGLPKDVLMETALNLSPPDLISLCATNKKQNDALCNSEIFWRRKLEKDYPEEFLQFYISGHPVQNPKKIYINRFTYISRQLEMLIDKFIDSAFGGRRFRTFMNDEYRKGLYRALYTVYEETRVLNEDDEDGWDDEVIFHTEKYAPILENWDGLVGVVKRNMLELHHQDKVNAGRKMTVMNLKKKK